jgi:ribosome maturation factor RimP
MLRDRLVELLRPVVEGLGFELWELEYSASRGHGMLRIYVDSDNGVTLHDCEIVSVAVSERLDAEDPIAGHYTLEVSSPGVERPLRLAEHFARFVGEEVFVELSHMVANRRRFKGRLLSAGPQSVAVEVDGVRYDLPLDLVRRAHLAPQD